MSAVAAAGAGIVAGIANVVGYSRPECREQLLLPPAIGHLYRYERAAAGVVQRRFGAWRDGLSTLNKTQRKKCLPLSVPAHLLSWYQVHDPVNFVHRQAKDAGLELVDLIGCITFRLGVAEAMLCPQKPVRRYVVVLIDLDGAAIRHYRQGAARRMC
ncbi:MAG: hypothetical protein U5L02_10285 [Rheinheimera sp.]|nr:hypothetical protein [Rheinheimera sp.]